MTIPLNFDPTFQVYIFLAIFARIGGMMMLMPVFGEISIAPQFRLTLALAVSLVLMPGVGHFYPALPATPLVLAGLVVTEAVIGVFIGTLARIVVYGLQSAGTILAFQTSLGFAQALDPTQGVQGALLGTFLSLLGITLIVVTDLHHLMLAAMRSSYDVFAPGVLPDIADASKLVLDTVARSFLLAMQLCAPFLVFGLVFYLGMGLIAKLMPQLQIFFIAVPINILLAFAMTAVLIGTMMMWFLNGFQATLTPFVP